MAEQQSAQDKLFDAIQEADLERMKLCLENGAEINSELLKRRGPEYFTLVLTKIIQILWQHCKPTGLR